MPRVTQRTERPGLYTDKFNAIKIQMLKNSKIKRTVSNDELDTLIKQSLIDEANDKIEFSLRGEIRRGKPAKLGLSVDEFEREWRVKMKDRLVRDGYPFTLTKEEKETLASYQDKKKKEAAEEITKIASDAMRKMLSSIE